MKLKGRRGRQAGKQAAPKPATSKPRIPARLRGTIFSGVVAVLIIAALAAGPSMLPQAGPPTSELLAKMARALQSPDASSASFDGKLTLTGSTAITQEPFSASTSVSGRFTGQGVRIEATVPGSGKVNILLLGSGFYLRSSGSGWRFFPLRPVTQLVTEKKAPAGAKAPGGPGEILRKLRSLDGQSLEGPIIDDTPTYEVRTLSTGIAPADGDQVDALISNAKASLFLGQRDSLPRRLDLSLQLNASDLGSAGPAFSNLAGSVDVDVQIDFFDWGEAPAVRAPRGAIDESKALREAAQKGMKEIPALLGLP